MQARWAPWCSGLRRGAAAVMTTAGHSALPSRDPSSSAAHCMTAARVGEHPLFEFVHALLQHRHLALDLLRPDDPGGLEGCSDAGAGHFDVTGIAAQGSSQQLGGGPVVVAIGTDGEGRGGHVSGDAAALATVGATPPCCWRWGGRMRCARACAGQCRRGSRMSPGFAREQHREVRHPIARHAVLTTPRAAAQAHRSSC